MLLRGRQDNMQKLRILLVLAFWASVAFAYDLGVSHNYKYETSVVVDEDCNDGSKDLVGHSLRADVQLTNVWQDPKNQRIKLLRIKVSAPQLLATKKSAFEVRAPQPEKMPAPESYLLLQDGRVQKFWDDPSEHPLLRNLKRAVASLLQVERKDGEEKVDDVSGKCGVLYKVEGNTVRRSLGNCLHPIQGSTSTQSFGVRSSTVQSATGIDCDLQDTASKVISRCVATERVKTFSNLWRKPSICILSTSGFFLEGTSTDEGSFKGSDYESVIGELKKKGDLVEGNLYSVTTQKDDKASAKILDSTKSFQESLKSANLAKLKSASAFFKLLPSFRAATKQDIKKVLETKKFTPILPQILDLVAAASSSKDAVDAALTHFTKTDDYDENLERYLISLSVLPRPSSYVLKELKAFSEKGNRHEKIRATLLTTLGSLLRTYCKNSDEADSKVVEEVLGYLEKSLKVCKGQECIQSRLRGLRNAARPESTSLLLQYALKGGKPALEALLAIRNVPHSQLSRENQESLQKIFNGVGVRQDRSARAVASDILLRGRADDDVLKSVLGALSDQTDPEFTSFVVAKVFRLMDENEPFRSRMLKILTEREVSHYYSLSQKGKSSLFKRQLMSATGLNVTYGIEMELLEGGLLKRSVFDVEFETEAEVSNLLSVGMFAEGMASFAGDSSSGDEGDPTAGMELTLLGTALRPYIFFSSTSELMGHAWSGTASEPTPALQGIFPLNDDKRLLVLHNGMLTRLELRGVMSADLSASIQISLWSRNSQSQVKNSAAILVKGSAVVDADFVETRGEYLYYGQSSIDFGTDLEFAEAPFKMCLQMEHPNIIMKHDFQRSVEVEEAKFSAKKTKKRKRFIPSRSYALHQNNNELCRIMKGSGYN